jgi:hypothetical protein
MKKAAWLPCRHYRFLKEMGLSSAFALDQVGIREWAAILA